MKSAPLVLLLLSTLLVSAPSSRADGPADNLPEKVRRVPPPGLKIADNDRAELERGAEELAREITSARTELSNKPALFALLPDAEIYHKAVSWALRYDEFFKTNETQVARPLLQQGRERVQQLRAGSAPWLTATGLVVRGYRSRIDDSVQPYGLVVPASFRAGGPHRFRLDFWFHGRGETLTELAFLNDRQRSPGEFAPPDAFVLHPYGRYCNGSRFAGETDAFEALEHARKFYPLDDERLVVRGFSLGGAACWHFAVHHAGRWAAAAPGAGFSETADFLKVFQNEKLQPADWEQKLWHLYDATDHAINLFHCPTVAYSGENDRQKQAADLMAHALADEGIELTHVIGPKTGHSYHADAKREINHRIDRIVAHGREPAPRQIRFTTWTLRYNEMRWLTIDGLERHWERARVEADIVDATTVRVVTTNVTALTLAMDAGECPLDPTRRPRVVLDGQSLDASRSQSDRSWTVRFAKSGGRWQLAETRTDETLRKRHGLQGPIDDAFMESFVMVRPTGPALNDRVARWVNAELAHATNHWRQQFRGDARVKNDDAITDDDIANHNLIFWGDPSSNRLLARLADKLPVRWDASQVTANGKTYEAAQHVPVLIFPNPLNPRRYIVLNSGFTFREYDYLNNARQTPKLPDFAVIDVSVPANSRTPGGIVVAGFFDEAWKWPAP